MNRRQIFKLAHCLLLILASAHLSTAQKPELVVQTGHSSNVNSVAFSPDGRTLASGSGDNTVKLWDVSTGTELRTLTGHSLPVKSVAFSPDGKTLASGSWDKTVKLWDVSTGAELRNLRGEAFGEVNSVAFSPDGKTLASGGLDWTVRLWDVSTGAEFRNLRGEASGELNSVAIGSDGKILAGGFADKTVKLWDLTTGKLLRSLEGHTDEVWSVAFSLDGKTLASGGMDNTVKLWDVSTGTELRTLSGHSNYVTSVAFSHDGKTLASGGADSSVRLWDVSTGTESRTLNGYRSVAFSPDAKFLVSGGRDNTIKLWDVSTGAELRTLRGRSYYLSSVAVSPDGKTLAGSGPNEIKLWDVSTGTDVRTLNGPFDWAGAAFSPDGKTLASGGTQHVSMWNVSTGVELRTLKGHSKGINSVAFSPDGKTLVSSSDDKTVKLWDVSSGAELRTLTGALVSSVVFSPDGKTLAGSDFDKIKLWDVSSGAALRTLKGHSDRIRTVVFSPDGKTLASGSDDKTVKLWDVSNGLELRTLKGHSGYVFSIAFSPDGETLASGSWDNTVKLWSVSTGAELHTLTGHNRVTSVAISLNNRYLVSVSSNTSIEIWEISSGKELASMIALDQNDWAVVTPEGLFDGSPNAWKKLIWRLDHNTFKFAPVEAFFKEFYYPGLLPEIMAGKRPTPPAKNLSEVDIRQPSINVTRVDLQAVVQHELGLPLTLANPVSKRSTEIEIQVTDNMNAPSRSSHPATSGATDLRLFRNGSLVKLWPGDVFDKQGGCEQMVGNIKEPRRAVCKATVSVVEGDNKLTTYAFNHENVKSNDTTLTVTGADSLKRKGTLHILAVGVSQYANREYNLDYTTDDATSFATQLKLEQEKQSRYQTVEIKTLLNENATKANILAELKKLAAAVQPEDALVVYFSGHGKASGDHFYLVPHDLGYTGSRDQLSAEGLKAILAHSISDQELEEAFRGIDAGQMFMIIDACNSGQALENKDEPRRGPMNTRGLAQLAYEKGIYIMTASQNVEEAFVSEKLKHSYLTFALVEEGLKTKVADADHDGKVMLREWFDYALTRVPKLREETLQSKSLDEINPTTKAAARNQKSQTPRVFYRRELDSNPLVVAMVGATLPQ